MTSVGLLQNTAKSEADSSLDHYYQRMFTFGPILCLQESYTALQNKQDRISRRS